VDALVGALGLALLVVVPGYALARLLFPVQAPIERAVLSVSLSLGVNLLAGSVLALAGLFTRPALFVLVVALSVVFLAARPFVQRQRA
jgi:uncharacterized membrane protein